MKLLVLSDLHLEFANFVPDAAATEAADLVVLAGDIHKGTQGIVWARKTFPTKEIIYVAGNHEFYGEHWDMLLRHFRMLAGVYDIHFLENDSVTIDGIRFLGTTLWTNFEFFGQSRRSQMMRLAETGMNDFRLIKAEPLAVKLVGLAGTVAETRITDYRSKPRLSPTHTVLRHRESLAWLQAELSNRELGDPDKTVVVTHHYPCKRSTAAKWASDPLTAAFGSKLDMEMLTQAKIWIHGHTHDSCDYRLGDSERPVRVVCNPRGYPLRRLTNEFENPAFNPGLLIEIETS
jgi:predicted phosphodiesterase